METTDSTSTIDRKTLLESALETLSGYHTLQCGQVHESVVQIGRADEFESHMDYPGWQLKIKGLCSSGTRNSTLGCSHSMVMTNYNWLMEKLFAEKAIAVDAVPMKEINDVILKIYIMDHEKGKLEKDLAVLKNELPETQQAVSDIVDKLEELRQGHVAFIQRLDALHQVVLEAIRKEIVNS